MQKPHNIFLIDAIGALLSAIGHGWLLQHFQSVFGIPLVPLKYFTAIAMVYFIYSSSIFLMKPNNWRPYIKIIAILNMLFCIASSILLFLYKDIITVYGMGYIMLECIIVYILVRYEWRMAQQS